MSLQTDIWSIFNTAKRNSETVVWQDSILGSNVRPDKPYITLKLLSIRQVGHDEVVNTGNTSGLGAEEKLETEQIMHHEITLNCQYLSDSQDSIFKAEELRSYIQSEDLDLYISSRNSDIRFMRAEPVLDISAIIRDAYENRSSFDVVMSLSITRQELVQFINTIEISGQVEVSEDDIILYDVDINL